MVLVLLAFVAGSSAKLAREYFWKLIKNIIEIIIPRGLPKT